MHYQLRAGLVIEALEMVIARRKPERGFVHTQNRVAVRVACVSALL
jgi:hypothetical protein